LAHSKRCCDRQTRSFTPYVSCPQCAKHVLGDPPTGTLASNLGKRASHWLVPLLPCNPASRRTAQAGRLCYQKRFLKQGLSLPDVHSNAQWFNTDLCSIFQSASDYSASRCPSSRKAESNRTYWQRRDEWL